MILKIRDSVECPECGYEFDPRDEGWYDRKIDHTDEATNFGEWIFENNITKETSIPDAYVYMGKWVTMMQLYDIFTSKYA